MMQLKLPIWSRSRTYVKELLAEPVVDLEIMSRVVLADACLAFVLFERTSHVASVEAWRPDLALVQIGKRSLSDLIDSQPLIEKLPVAKERTEVESAQVRAIIRGCVAAGLASKMGIPKIGAAFLAGLLYSVHELSPAQAFLNQGQTVADVRTSAADWGKSRYLSLRQAAVGDRALAVAELAEQIITTKASSECLQDSFWQAWSRSEPRARREAVEHGLKMEHWAQSRVASMTPWRFGCEFGRMVAGHG